MHMKTGHLINMKCYNRKFLCQQVGGLTAIILLDCDEQYMQQKGRESGADSGLVAKRVSEYKHHVLPVLGYLDDVGKLEIVLVSVKNSFVSRMLPPVLAVDPA